MRKIICVLLVFISTTCFGQTKHKIKTIYEETNDLQWSREYKNYFSYNKKGSIVKTGKWKFDSIANDYLILSEKVNKISKPNLKKSYDSSNNLTSSIKFFKKGPLEGLINRQKAYLYNSANKLIKTKVYISRVDTLDIGYDQFNFEKKVNREYINYNLKIAYEAEYNNKDQIVKEIYYRQQEGMTYKYDKNTTEIKTYRFYGDENELSLFKDNKVDFNEDNFFEKRNFIYKYDKQGNWIEKKIYNYDYSKPLLMKVTRKIEYF